jgi:hypothetical protein
VQKIGNDFYFSFWKRSASPPKPSHSEGKQEFHLHTTGFETQDPFGGSSFPEWAISVSLHQPGSGDQSVFFTADLLPNCEV